MLLSLPRFWVAGAAAVITAAATAAAVLLRPVDSPLPPAYQTTVTLPRAGEAHLQLHASAPGCDWGKAGSESAVVTVFVDGERKAEIVLFGGGDKAQPYDVMLGALSAGDHTLRVLFRPDLSPKGARGMTVERAEIRVRDKNAEEALVWKHAPLLYGRKDNATTDVPLLLYYELTEEQKAWHLVYSLIWSNEDGGTGNDLGSLVSRWGRSTDIEWIYEVWISKETGNVEKAVIQAAGHKIADFAGMYRGKHPLLRTSTTNNMVSDTGTSPLLFAPAPLRAIRPDRETREAMMDAFPLTHEIAAKEMRREGKWEPITDPATIAASDIRSYLHVDYRAQCAGGALLAVQVRLNDGRVFFSDHGRAGDAIGRSGWVRTTVELPPGTKAAAVADLTFARRDRGSATLNGTATVQAARAFFLLNDYRPAKTFWQLSGVVEIRNSRTML